MSRNGLWIAVLALLVAVGGLVIQFVGAPSDGGSDVAAELQAMQDDIMLLKQQEVSSSLKVGFVNAEKAVTVFTDQVNDLRQEILDKQAEILQLQQEYVASTISKDDYEKQYNVLQVEMLQAQLTVDITSIDKMIAADGFSNIRADLQRLREQAQPVVDEMKNLVNTARVGVIDALEFNNRYAQLQSAFTQIDTLLTQAASAKIAEVSQQLAIEGGYDLVLNVQNVIVYRNEVSIIDITDDVKERLLALY